MCAMYAAGRVEGRKSIPTGARRSFTVSTGVYTFMRAAVCVIMEQVQLEFEHPKAIII